MRESNTPPTRDRLLVVMGAWLDDEDSDVVAVEEVDGRVAVRLRQVTRDFTTVWCDPRERTLRLEAYVLPAPSTSREAVYRLLLRYNAGLRDAAFALDEEGAVVLVARLWAEDVGEDRLQLVFGELWEGVERAFRPLARIGFERETSA